MLRPIGPASNLDASRAGSSLAGKPAGKSMAGPTVKPSMTPSAIPSSRAVPVRPLTAPKVQQQQQPQQQQIFMQATDGEDQKLKRKEVLEQRRKFLEELSRFQPEKEGREQEEGDAAKQVAEGTGKESTGIEQELEAVSRSTSQEEWDAKWRGLYGALCGDEVAGADMLEDTGEGESLLTEEELEAFRTSYGTATQARAAGVRYLASSCGYVHDLTAASIALPVESCSGDSDDSSDDDD